MYLIYCKQNYPGTENQRHEISLYFDTQRNLYIRKNIKPFSQTFLATFIFLEVS